MYKDSIRAIYEHLSPGYRRIADFVVDRYQDAAFMTAAEIGRATQVDTALVVRFAQRLGYPGYPELINDIQEDVKRDLRAVYEPTEGDNSPAQVFRRNLMQDRNNLDFLLLHLDLDAIEEVIGLLTKATRIFVIGEGSVEYIAEAFAMRLVTEGFPAHAISAELANQLSMITHFQRSDVLVGIGMTSLTPGVSVILKVAHDAGMKTIAIAGSATHPIAAAADLVLLVPVRTVGIMPSPTAICAVSHALFQAIAISRGESTADRAMRAGHFIKTYVETLQRDLDGVMEVVKSYNA